MALQEIPCVPSGQSHWTQRTQLSGTEYLLTFDWNQRDGHWSLSIADGAGASLYAGLVLVTGMQLLAQLEGVRLLPGDFLVIDSGGGTDEDPGFADLGARFALCYIGP